MVAASKMAKHGVRSLAVLLPALIAIILWQTVVDFTPSLAFFIGSPTLVVRAFAMEVTSSAQIGSFNFPAGKLFVDTAVTGWEAIAGFFLGSLFGTILGLWFSLTPGVSRVFRPYIIALGTAPLFAFAPIIVLWFGVGIESKVLVATLSTIFVALMQAFRGANETDRNLIQVAKSFGATDRQAFRKIVIPSAAVWVINGFRLNVGFALLGAFLGEFINSSDGLGHLILVSGGLYNIPLVLVGVMMISALGLALTAGVDSLEPGTKRLLSKIC